jgi:hypothetical protein
MPQSRKAARLLRYFNSSPAGYDKLVKQLDQIVSLPERIPNPQRYRERPARPSWHRSKKGGHRWF